MKECYTFKVAPDYTIATYYHADRGIIVLDEWRGRTADEFNAGMKDRGFTYTKETYTLSRGEFTEHIWSR